MSLTKCTDDLMMINNHLIECVEGSGPVTPTPVDPLPYAKYLTYFDFTFTNINSNNQQCTATDNPVVNDGYSPLSCDVFYQRVYDDDAMINDGSFLAGKKSWHVGKSSGYRYEDYTPTSNQKNFFQFGGQGLFLPQGTYACWIKGRSYYKEIRTPSQPPKYIIAAWLNFTGPFTITLMSDMYGPSGYVKIKNSVASNARKIIYKNGTVVEDGEVRYYMDTYNRWIHIAMVNVEGVINLYIDGKCVVSYVYGSSGGLNAWFQFQLPETKYGWSWPEAWFTELYISDVDLAEGHHDTLYWPRSPLISD